ncbi:MAG: gamma-glutamyltransferase [Chitinophagales bacterium]|nr:gamma-glutamyltransferase [Chitinophagales bacterium]
MVVSAHPIASKVGAQIMRNGGNAFDAMVAVHFALAVVYPRAGNLGGGGFMVSRTANGNMYTLDFREKAPAAAHAELYLDKQGNVIEGLSLNTHLSAGVPGSVDGMLRAHERFGTVSLADLIQPSIELARVGFYISQDQAATLNRYEKELKERNENIPWIKDEIWKSGDLVQQEDLANSLTKIAERGWSGFYRGETAQQIVDESKRGNGIITAEDLENYSSVWREPIVGYYDEYKIIGMPPPSSGGIALMQILKMIEDCPIHKWGPDNKKTIHLIVEAERRAYADRSKHLGDPDFYDIPEFGLLNTYYLESRMNDFERKRASISNDIEPGNPPVLESVETTHYSIVDQFGNAVSVTTTLNGHFGSKIYVDGAGFFLNNEMDDFSSKPGVPNMFGLIGGEANLIEAGKRMLSSMTPTIVEKDGSLFMVLGSPGGSTIITSVLQVFLNVTEHEMGMQEAVSAKRFHHQWLPDKIFVEENTFDSKLKGKLSKMGHEFEMRRFIGKVDAILVKDKLLYGGADPRGDDTASGF